MTAQPINAGTPHNWGALYPGHHWQSSTRRIINIPKIVFPNKPTTHTTIMRCVARGGPRNPWRLSTWVAPMKYSDFVPIGYAPNALDAAIDFAQRASFSASNQWEDHLIGIWGSVRVKLNFYKADKRHHCSNTLSSTGFGEFIGPTSESGWIVPGESRRQDFACDANSIVGPLVSGAKFVRIGVGVNLSVSASFLPIEFSGSNEDPANWVQHSEEDMLYARSWVSLQFNPFADMLVDEVVP